MGHSYRSSHSPTLLSSWQICHDDRRVTNLFGKGNHGRSAMMNSQQSLIMDLCDPRGPFADSHRVPRGGTCAAARNLAASRLGPSADQAANVKAGVRLRGSPSVERVRFGVAIPRSWKL